MPTNEVRRELLNRVRSTGYPGGITEVFQAADQGIDLIEQHQLQQEQQQMQVANTPQEQEVGLREQHAMGNTQASMAFPDVQPNQSFNTVGMQVPINIDKIDNQGHLVESYKNVPPGIQDLPTGPSKGTVIESPAGYQKGGVYHAGGLYHNINHKKKSGTSRSKANSTISAKNYANMKSGFKKQAGGFNPDDINPTPYMPPQFPQGRREKGASWNLKKGVRAVESANGKLMKNSKTPATGFYGQFFNQIQDLPFMDGITRDEFAADTTLQNKVFDMRYKGQIPDVPGLKSNVKKLRSDYGDLTKGYTDDELAALSNFTGRRRAREYFASIREGTEFKMPGEDTGDNKSVEQYMKEYRKAVKKKKKGGFKAKFCW